jgi:hypothetical protein
LRGLPHQQQLQHHHHGMRLMSPEGLQHRSHAGEPRTARVPDRLRKLPRYRPMD